MKPRIFFALGLSVVALMTQVQAALYTIDWASGTGNSAYVAANTVVTSTANTTGTQVADFRNGFATYDQDQSGGWLRFGQSQGITNLTTQGQVDSNYWTFTVTANEGYTLDLTSLVFDARRATGNTDTTPRGFEIWATTNGAAFDINSAADQRLLRILSPTPDALGNRVSGATPFSLNLSGVDFQGIDSVTFRVYHLSSATTFNGVEFGDLTLNGQAVPEPSAALLAGLGACCLLRRRRS